MRNSARVSKGVFVGMKPDLSYSKQSLHSKDFQAETLAQGLMVLVASKTNLLDLKTSFYRLKVLRKCIETGTSVVARSFVPMCILWLLPIVGSGHLVP